MKKQPVIQGVTTEYGGFVEMVRRIVAVPQSEIDALTHKDREENSRKKQTKKRAVK